VAPDVEPAVFQLPRTLVEEMFAHARGCAPEECCGLLGGGGRRAANAYPLRNVAPRPEVAYEAAPEELFEAQRSMRARGEALVGVYHSHPRSSDPAPSRTDVRLAFYPEAFYFIIGLDEEGECVLRAFLISEREGRWEPAPFEVGG
jgi:[CysO sulfur-carrier protein]-S-L-cysteine hydrolase